MKLIISTVIFFCMSTSFLYAENISEVLNKKAVETLSMEKFSNKKTYKINRKSVGDIIAKQNPCELFNVKKNGTLTQQ